MLGIGGLIFITFLCIKLSLELNKHKDTLCLNGISKAKFRFFQITPLFYVIGVAVFALLPLFQIIEPTVSLLVSITILCPGIVIGKDISKSMEVVGLAAAAKAGRAASNIMWLGVVSIIFIVANIVIGLLMASL